MQSPLASSFHTAVYDPARRGIHSGLAQEWGYETFGAVQGFDWAGKSEKFSQAGEGLTGSQIELSHCALGQLRAWPPCRPGADKTDCCVRPAALPSPIVCKDKRDADGPTLWQGRRAREETADPGSSSGHLLGQRTQGPLRLPGPQRGPVGGGATLRGFSHQPLNSPSDPLALCGSPPLGNQQIAGGLSPVTGIKWPTSRFSYKTLSPEVGTQC